MVIMNPQDPKPYEPTVEEVEKCAEVIFAKTVTAWSSCLQVAPWHLRTLHEATEKMKQEKELLLKDLAKAELCNPNELIEQLLSKIKQLEKKRDSAIAESVLLMQK